MGINSEKDSFVYLKPEEDSNRYANIEIIENPFSEQDEFSDLGWKNYSSDSYQREALVSFGCKELNMENTEILFKILIQKSFQKYFSNQIKNNQLIIIVVYTSQNKILILIRK